MAASPGPTVLWLVRHAESQGNVADAQAHDTGADRLQLDIRDPDVELSDTGRGQAEGLGRWLTTLDPDERPTAALSSPYTRAATTAQIAVAAAGLDVDVHLDERLRERDFGAFDGMTRKGIEAEYPDEAKRRTMLGKFYYRPPGGESWADVALRIRSFMGTVELRYDGERLMVASHQAVLLVFRYVLEGLTESELLDIDKREQVSNCAVTRYERDADGVLRLTDYNNVDHLVQSDEDVTEEPSAPTQA